MLEVHILGTSSARPAHGRSVSGTIVRHEGTTVAIDCGEGFQNRVVEHNRDLKDSGRNERTRLGKLNCILLTHGHLDHTWGLLPMLHTMALDNRHAALNVVAPTSHATITRLLDSSNPFDTFEGFPSISDEDRTTATEPPARKVGGFYVSDDHYEQLQQSVTLFDDNRLLNHVPKIELVKGDALATIPSYLETNPQLLISLLYLDFDLYEPTLKALRLLYDRVVTGGIVALDEINDPRWPGETKAFLQVLLSPVRLLQLFRHASVPAAVVPVG